MASRGITAKEVEALCQKPASASKNLIFKVRMYPIKDPRKSIPFYTGVLGMSLLQQLHFPEMGFSLFFLGYENMCDKQEDPRERKLALTTKAAIELTYTWGSESEKTVYHYGNSDPHGLGQYAIWVPDVDEMCARFEAHGVKYIKKPNVGEKKGAAFVQDPDGYWIDIIKQVQYKKKTCRPRRQTR